MALALALSVGMLITAHIQINRTGDRLDVGEEILLGDPSAYSLTAFYNVRGSGRHLLWNTVFTPGRGDKAETDFRFRLISEYPQTTYAYVNLSAYLGAYGSMSGSATLHMLPDPLRRVVEEIASRTPVGESLTETIQLTDYYQYYPILFDASRDGHEVGILHTEEGTQALEEYFQLKMDNRETAEITVEKFDNGEIFKWDVYPSRTWGNLSSSGIITERGIYLIADSVDDEGNPDNRLQCRDGQGVHFIPSRGADPVPFVEKEWYDMTQIHLFYPTEAEILEMYASPDESKLLLYTREADQYVLTVIDAVTGGTLQRLELMELEADGWPRLIRDGSLCLAVVNQSGKFSLVSEENGVYSNVLRGVVDTPEVSLSHARSLAWDGSYLAFAVSIGVPAGFLEIYPPDYIGVTGGDGLLCLSRYNHSISRDPVQRDYLTACYGSDQPALAVAFAEK